MSSLRTGLLACVFTLSASLFASAEAQTPLGQGDPQFRIDLSRGDSDAETYANYLSARFAATQHNLGDAAKYYRESLEADPNNNVLLTLAFFYSTSAGDMDDAVKLAKKMTEGTGDDRVARLTLAIAALRDRDYAEARKDLTQSAKGPFTTLTSALIDAWAAAGLKDQATAIADLKALSTDAGTDALTAFHEGMLYEYLGRNDEADAAYRDALLKTGPSPRVVDAYGRFLERNGRTAEASALSGKLATDTALAPIVQPALARIAAGRKPDPLVSRPEEGVAEALFGIAGSLTDQSSVDISILYLRLALFLRPNLDLAGILLADRFESIQKYEDAIAVYRGIDRDSAYYRLAQIQVAIDEAQLNKSDAAIADLEKLTRDDPTSLEGWTALGDAYRSVERWNDASAAYDKALALLTPVAQKDWPLYYSRAVAEERGRRWDAAEADLQTALKLSPDQPEVLNYLGYSWVDQGMHIPEALAMLEKARSLRPFDGYIVDSVGWAYFKLARYADAAKTLENAVLLVPGDPTINDHLGDAYWRVGKKLDARFQWNHALAFGPDPAEKSTIEDKLKNGLPAGVGPG